MAFSVGGREMTTGADAFVEVGPAHFTVTNGRRRAPPQRPPMAHQDWPKAMSPAWAVLLMRGKISPKAKACISAERAAAASSTTTTS